MDEENYQPQPAPAGKPIAREVSAAVLHDAIEGLKARGETTRRMACMSLPTPIFNDLCERLMEKSTTVRDTADWLAGQTPDAPSRSAVDRFAQVLFAEYRIALAAQRRTDVSEYVAREADSDPDAMVMAAQRMFVDRFTDLMLKLESFEGVDADQLYSMTSALKAIAQVAFGKQAKDARLRESESRLRKAQAEIAAKELKLKEAQDKAEAALKSLQAKADRKDGAGVITAEDIVAARRAIFGN
jgi:hypothetical protein